MQKLKIKSQKKKKYPKIYYVRVDEQQRLSDEYLAPGCGVDKILGGGFHRNFRQISKFFFKIFRVFLVIFGFWFYKFKFYLRLISAICFIKLEMLYKFSPFF